jgi:hypothetical protein
MSKVNSKIDEWEESYDAIHKDVSTFTKVSDPKTIRLYVKELNKILDEIHFLGRLIENGQLADEGLTAILNEQIAMNKKILKMVTLKAYNKTTGLLREDLETLYEGDEYVRERLYNLNKDTKTYIGSNKKMYKQLDGIQDEINDIKSLLKEMNKKKFIHTHKK